MSRCMLWNRMEFDLIALDECYVFGFFKLPELSKKPIPVENGLIYPGDIVVKLGGKKTSAGFTRIDFYDGAGFEFVGSRLTFEGEIICFNNIRDNKVQRIPEDAKGHWTSKYKVAYYGFVVIKPGLWFHCNRAGSGRIVETTFANIEKRGKNATLRRKRTKSHCTA